MPLVRVDLRKGKPAGYRKAILDSIYDAMISSFNVPKDDRFMVINEHDETEFSYSPTYFNIARSDDLILIRLTVSNTRNVEQKKALFHQIVENLKTSPGVRPEDVFINLVEVDPANWSFGLGIAQYVADKT